jgi:hypothetical protein
MDVRREGEALIGSGEKGGVWYIRCFIVDVVIAVLDEEMNE